LAQIVDGDIVGPRAGARDAQQAVAELHTVHIGAAHQYGGGVFAVGVYGDFFRGQPQQADR
jgi:hypothetical protein